MKPIPVEIAGPSYKDRSQQLSNQKTQNFYLGPGRHTQWTLYNFPGCKNAVTRGGKDRGLYVFQGILYQVSNGYLIRINSDLTVETIGSVIASDRVIFDDDGLNLFMTTGDVTYVYNGSSISVVSSSNLETPVSVSYLNGFFLYDGDEGRFQASDAGDGTTINDLSVGVANSDGDPILRGIVHDQLIYWYGSRSIEPWYYSGTGNLPFERLEQGIVQMGLGATYSVAADVNAQYFLGADRQVYKLTRSVPQSISSASVREIETFATISDAIGWTLTFENQNFYWLTFPAESRSFLYSDLTKQWVDLSFGMSGERHLANSYAYCYGKHWVADYRNGNIYELDINTYTDNGQPQLRWRDTAPITGNNIGLPGHRIVAGSLQVLMEVGVGLNTGQGSDPEIMCNVSGDGGLVFGAEDHIAIGVMGENRKRVDFYQFIDGYSIVYRILCSDPVYLSIFGGIAEVDDGGY